MTAKMKHYRYFSQFLSARNFEISLEHWGYCKTCECFKNCPPFVSWKSSATSISIG